MAKTASDQSQWSDVLQHSELQLVCDSLQHRSKNRVALIDPVCNKDMNQCLNWLKVQMIDEHVSADAARRNVLQTFDAWRSSKLRSAAIITPRSQTSSFSDISWRDGPQSPRLYLASSVLLFWASDDWLTQCPTSVIHLCESEVTGSFTLTTSAAQHKLKSLPS